MACVISYVSETGLYNGLFLSTVITHSFDVFINIIGVIIFLPEGNSVDSVLLAVTPLVVYANPHLEKQSILKENKGKSGVYR
jgi:hypothetical protein